MDYDELFYKLKSNPKFRFTEELFANESKIEIMKEMIEFHGLCLEIFWDKICTNGKAMDSIHFAENEYLARIEYPNSGAGAC